MRRRGKDNIDTEQQFERSVPLYWRDLLFPNATFDTQGKIAEQQIQVRLPSWRLARMRWLLPGMNEVRR